MNSLTEVEAYDVMVAFLVWYQQSTGSDLRVSDLLIDIRYATLNRAGVPETGDPGCWYDWLTAVKRVISER